MQFGQDLSLQLSPQTHENPSKLPEMTKTALESLLSRCHCELKSYLVIIYLQIQNPINLISMPTTYLESFGADLSENELF